MYRNLLIQLIDLLFSVGWLFTNYDWFLQHFYNIFTCNLATCYNWENWDLFVCLFTSFRSCISFSWKKESLCTNKCLCLQPDTIDIIWQRLFFKNKLFKSQTLWFKYSTVLPQFSKYKLSKMHILSPRWPVPDFRYQWNGIENLRHFAKLLSKFSRVCDNFQVKYYTRTSLN